MENGKWKMEKGRSFSIFHFPLSMALWLLPQLLILLLTLFHVPLWLQTPIRMDDLALPALLCVQVVTAAMAFPLLLRDWASTAAAVVVTWPMIQLAAFASGIPLGQWGMAAAYLSLLLLVLGLWNRVLRSDRAQLAGAAGATALTVGGALLAYLQAEFSGQSAPAIDLGRASSPLLGALGQLQPTPSAPAWWGLAGALIAGGLTLFLRRRRRSL